VERFRKRTFRDYLQKYFLPKRKYVLSAFVPRPFHPLKESAVAPWLSPGSEGEAMTEVAGEAPKGIRRGPADLEVSRMETSENHPRKGTQTERH
jgi:hypothetical protein